MDSRIWFIIGVLVLLIVLGIFMFFMMKSRKEKSKGLDYHSLFIIGIIWVIIGIFLKNYFLLVLGGILFLAGILNKKKWKSNKVKWEDFSKEEKKMRIWMVSILAIILIAGIIVFFIFS